MQRNNGIIIVLRKVTNIVKVAPFLFALILMITIIGYMFLPRNVLDMLDSLFYISPLASLLMILLSKELYLCKWHRLECVLPVIAIIPDIIDVHIHSLSDIAEEINLALMTMIFLLSLINAYFVFIKPSKR